MEGSASGGRHAPIEWREEESDSAQPAAEKADRMEGWREERAGMMDRQMRGRGEPRFTLLVGSAGALMLSGLLYRAAAASAPPSTCRNTESLFNTAHCGLQSLLRTREQNPQRQSLLTRFCLTRQTRFSFYTSVNPQPPPEMTDNTQSVTVHCN